MLMRTTHVTSSVRRIYFTLMVTCGRTHERCVEARGRERVIQVRSIEVRDMGL